MPFDCGVTIEQQMNEVYRKGIDVLFVTNHNTVDGYRQMLEYKKDHAKFANLQIYPAEEVTTDTNGHVIAYGIHTRIRPLMSLEEILDEIRKQGAVSSAPHPFAVTNGIREKASLCDMIEVFNSNNIDRFSNFAAKIFASANNMVQIAGSDSHLTSTIGRCLNLIESENTLDDILGAMKGNKIQIREMRLISHKEVLEHARYILLNSAPYLLDYAKEYHPKLHGIAEIALGSFTKSPNSAVWGAISWFALFLTKRVSEKVNVRGYSPDIFVNRRIGKILQLALSP
jgi:predicted metal-dependent phosphoesterase TrpH